MESQSIAGMKTGAVAVVVTFNRKLLLCETLDALLAQKGPLRSIIIVDNASTDGTPELLREKGYLDQERLEYLRLAKNTGGAGGFHEGLKRAYEEKFEWVWLMDDDVVPVPAALEKMLSYSNISKCIQACKIYEEGDSEGWEQWARIERSGARVPSKGPDHPDYIIAQTGCFEGMLIHHDVISQIGLPDKRFFIGGDDVAYGYLASKQTQVIFLREACFVKKLRKIGDRRLVARLRDRFDNRRSSRFYFLSVRNELLLYDYFRDIVRSKSFYIRIARLLLMYSFITLIFERSFGNFGSLWRGTFQGCELLGSPSREFDLERVS